MPSRRYVIKLNWRSRYQYADSEFDWFDSRGGPVFVRCGGGTLFRTKLWARVCRSWFPHDVRDACSIERVEV